MMSTDRVFVQMMLWRKDEVHKNDIMLSYPLENEHILISVKGCPRSSKSEVMSKLFAAIEKVEMSMKIKCKRSYQYKEHIFQRSHDKTALNLMSLVYFTTNLRLLASE